MDKTPVKATPKVQSSRRYVDEQTFRTLVRYSAGGNIGALIAIVVVYLTIPFARAHLIYCIVIFALALVGLIYCGLVWQRLHNRRPLFAIQFAILPPALCYLVGAWVTGGVNSPWYLMWVIAIVFSGMVGVLAVNVYAIITGLFYLGSVFILQVPLTKHVDDLSKLLMTAAAFVAAYMIGSQVERMVKTMQVAESLTKQLDSAELKQQLMMGAIADAVVAVNTDRKVVIFNEAAQSLTGWDLKSAMGVSYNLIFKLKDASDSELTDATDPFTEVLTSGKQIVTDAFSMLTNANQKIAFSISIAPTTDAQQNVNGAIAVFHDISDQKALARERNEFISTASHEMRTPVAAIEGYLSMSMNDKLATVDDRARNFINKAHESSLHLGKLFRDLLSVTKIEDNRMVINRRVFNMSELVSQVGGEMEIIARNKNLKLLTHIGGGGIGGELVVAPSFDVLADPDRVREVIANLVDNAIKYSPQGTIDIGLKADKRFVTFSVSDQGVGISPEDQKHLFQKFYRVNNTFTREVGGTGLGLYIARSLVERFGGRIWAESHEGKGSTFSFSLPLAKR